MDRSSLRYKEKFRDIGAKSAIIHNLRPVSFHDKSDESERLEFGLIAEEVEHIMPSLVIYDEDKLPETVKYLDLIPLMLNELKKLSLRVIELESKLKEI